jgi:hypothetical protein
MSWGLGGRVEDCKTGGFSTTPYIHFQRCLRIIPTETFHRRSSVSHPHGTIHGHDGRQVEIYNTDQKTCHTLYLCGAGGVCRWIPLLSAYCRSHGRKPPLQQQPPKGFDSSPRTPGPFSFRAILLLTLPTPDDMDEQDRVLFMAKCHCGCKEQWPCHGLTLTRAH